MSDPVEQVVLNFDGWLGNQPSDVQQGVQAHLNRFQPGEQQAEKDRLGAMYAVSSATGIDLGDVSQKWDMVRGGFAEQQGGDYAAVKDNEAGFIDTLKKHVEAQQSERYLIQGPDNEQTPRNIGLARDSLVNRASEAAYAGKSYADALGEWQTNAKGQPGYDEAHAATYEEIARKAYDATAAAVGKMRPVAANIFNSLAGNDGNSDPVAALRGLSPGEKEMAFRLIGDYAKSADAAASRTADAVGGSAETSLPDAVAQTVGRSFQNFIMGGGAGAWRSKLLQEHFNEGDWVTADSAQNQVRADFIKSNIARTGGTGDGGLTAPTLPDAPGADSRQLTAQEAADWNSQLKTSVDDINTVEHLRKLSQNDVNPITGGSLFRRKVLLPTLDSTALLAGLAIPGAQAAVLEMDARVYQNQQYERLTAMGMDPKEADTRALISGAALAARDKFAFGLLGKATQTLGVLQNLAFTGSAPLRFGINLGVTTGAEALTLATTEHVIPALVQDIANNNPKFDVAWGEVASEVAKDLPDTALGMVLLSGMGALHETSSQTDRAKQAEQFSSSPSAMRLAGISMEGIAEIQKAPDLWRKSALIDKFLPKSDAPAPQGEEREKLKADVEELAAKEKSVLDAKVSIDSINSAESADYAVRVIKGDNGWQVQRPDGSKMDVSSAEAARHIRDDLLQTGSQAEADALLKAIDTRDDGRKGGEIQKNRTFTGESVVGTDDGLERTRFIEPVREILSPKDLDRLHEESRMDAENSGSEPIHSIVNGQNQFEFRDKVAGSAGRIMHEIEINRGGEAAILTVLHEDVEDDWRTLEEKARRGEEGGISREETLAAIRAAAPAFDPAGAHDPETKKFRERLQKVARGEGNESEVRETVSALAVGETFARDQSGATVGAGAVRAALTEAINSKQGAGEVKSLGKFRAFLRATRQYFRAVIGTVAALRKANVGPEYHDFMDKLLGRHDQKAHERAAADEATGIAHEAGVEYKPPTQAEMDGGVAFSLSPSSRLEFVARTMRDALADQPEKRRLIEREANKRLQKLQFDMENRGIEEPRTAKSLNKEQAFREAARTEELQADVYGKYGELFSNSALTKVWESPLMSHLAKDGDPLHGRLMSESQAAKHRDTPEGYDGSDGVPRFVFGGEMRPDEMAQELFDQHLIKEPTPDAMWDAIRGELSSVAKYKGFLADAKQQLRDARNQAHEEMHDWRATADAKQAEDHSPKARLVRDMRTLDAIMSVLPAELRGKVGGFTKLAELSTDPARLKEIGRRIEKLSGLLEAHLRKENSAALDGLLEKAAPAGGKGEKVKGKVGVEGHRTFAQIEEIRGLNEEEVGARLTTLQKEQDAALEKNDSKALVALEVKRQLLSMFGNFEGKTAADGDAAVKWLADVYKTGRNAWNSIVEQRQNDRAALRERAIREVGGSGETRQIQGAKDKVSKGDVAFHTVRQFLGNAHRSFYQRLGSIFGVKAKTTEHFELQISKAAHEKAKAMVEMQMGIRDILLRAFKTKSWIKALNDFNELQRRQEKSGVMKLEGRERSNETVPVDKARLILDGRADPAAYDLSGADLPALRDALDTHEAGTQRADNLHLDVTHAEGTPVEQLISQNEAIHLTMLAWQPGYREGMDYHGWTEDSLAQMEKFLSPEAKQIRAWLRDQYEANYGRMNEVHKRLFGIDLPKVENYAPGYFENHGGREMNPFGTPGEVAGMTAGFLRQRINHKAEPVLMDAMQAYLGHMSMTEHWIHYAEPVSEARSVIGAVDVSKAITANEGEQAHKDLMSWLQKIEDDGVRDMQTNRWLRRVKQALTRVALAFKPGILSKHIVNGMASLSDVPFPQFMRGLMRVASGQSEAGLADIWNSDLIRSRLIGSFNPEARQIMEGQGAKGGWRARLGDFSDWGVARISWAASAFTTFSAAIAHDYHFRIAKEAKMNDAQARAYAEEKTMLTIARTAQPESVDRKSLIELERIGAGSLLMMFHSPERQQWGVAYSGVSDAIRGKGSKADAARKLAATWIISPILMQSIVGLWRYATTDDDAATAWDLHKYGAAIIMGPTSGIYGLGQIIESIARHKGAAGSKHGDAVQEMGMAVIRAIGHLKDGDFETPRIAEFFAAAGLVLGAGSDIPAESLKVLKNIYDQGEAAILPKDQKPHRR